MAPKSGNTGSKNPHITKRGRFNPNTNVRCGHPSCQVALRAVRDKEYYQKYGNPPVIYVSGARGIFHINDSSFRRFLL